MSVIRVEKDFDRSCFFTVAGWVGAPHQRSNCRGSALLAADMKPEAPENRTARRDTVRPRVTERTLRIPIRAPGRTHTPRVGSLERVSRGIRLECLIMS